MQDANLIRVLPLQYRRFRKVRAGGVCIGPEAGGKFGLCRYLNERFMIKQGCLLWGKCGVLRVQMQEALGRFFSCFCAGPWILWKTG